MNGIVNGKVLEEKQGGEKFSEEKYEILNRSREKTGGGGRLSVFKKCIHPAVEFLWFCGVICFCIAVKHPFYLGFSFLAGNFFNLLNKNWRGLKNILLCLPFFVFLSALNPLVSSWGQTPLFYVFGRPFTKEAFVYGLNMGLTFLVMLEWFLAFGCIMTVDKFTYLFSPFFPSVSLMLVMILRLVPLCTRRGREISETRQGAGIESFGFRGKFKERMEIFGAVMSSILEDGVMTALTMEKREYGTVPRTSFLNYRWRFGDFLELFVLAFGAFVVVLGIKQGFCSVNFYPVLSFSEVFGSFRSALTFFAFAFYLAVPVVPVFFEK